MIRLSRCFIGSAEEAAVVAVLRGAYLGMGKETQSFELELAEYLGGGARVVCVNTGTAALQLAIQACGLTVGDEVLVPSLTFVASFQAISATGAKPIACDVHEATGLLDLSDAAQKLTPRTKAIMPVHYASVVGDLDAIYEFGRRNNLRIVEDAAHAFGSTYRGQKIGSIGDIVCFSFDGIKNITSGEGGAVVTRDPEVLRRVQDARLLGVEKDTEKRFSGQRSWDFDVKEQGWRYHMSDVMAAIGRVQLRRFESELKPARVNLARRYREMLSGLQGLKLFEADLSCVVPHIQPVRILGGRRDEIRGRLESASVQTGIHYLPNHLLTKFRQTGAPLPTAERLHREILTLPLHPGLTETEIDSVVRVLRDCL